MKKILNGISIMTLQEEETCHTDSNMDELFVELPRLNATHA